MMKWLNKHSYTRLLGNGHVGLTSDDNAPEKDRIVVDEYDIRRESCTDGTDRAVNSTLGRMFNVAHFVLTLALLVTLLTFYQKWGPSNPIFPQMTYCSSILVLSSTCLCILY